MEFRAHDTYMVSFRRTFCCRCSSRRRCSAHLAWRRSARLDGASPPCPGASAGIRTGATLPTGRAPVLTSFEGPEFYGFWIPGIYLVHQNPSKFIKIHEIY